jgi:hypothetical protein
MHAWPMHRPLVQQPFHNIQRINIHGYKDCESLYEFQVGSRLDKAHELRITRDLNCYSSTSYPSPIQNHIQVLAFSAPIGPDGVCKCRIIRALAPFHGWKAMMDDVLDIARVGRYLLTDPYAPQEGIEALKIHNADGLKAWQSFLSF